MSIELNERHKLTREWNRNSYGALKKPRLGRRALRGFVWENDVETAMITNYTIGFLLFSVAPLVAFLILHYFAPVLLGFITLSK